MRELSLMAGSTKDGEYVLGVSREEYERLSLQHDLWKSRAIRLWRRAGVPERGARPVKAIDLGCGPGFTTLELARYLGPKGAITGVDLAEQYLAALAARWKALVVSGKPIARVETRRAGIGEFNLGDKDHDLAYARWIFIFLSDPEAAIRNVARHLRPGGLFLLQEYVDYGAMALYPENPPVFRKFVDAIIRSWADRGGDANVAARLPMLLERNGFEVISMKAQARVGRPTQKLWRWPDSFYRNYLPVLESEKYLTPAEGAEVRRLWSEASRRKDAFFQGPTVLDLIARKKP